MNILILEDEFYLAQKLASTLQEVGYNAYYSLTYEEVDKSINYDVVLLSTNVKVGNTEYIIKNFADSIVILLVAYVNDATVTKPIEAGAVDYITKPFMIKEVVRKIKHFEKFKKINQNYNNLIDFLNFIFQDLNTEAQIPSMPFLVDSNDLYMSKKVIFDISKQYNLDMVFMNVEEFLEKINELNDKLYIVYDVDEENASKISNIKHITNKNIIFCAKNVLNEFPYKKISYKNKLNFIQKDTILTLDEYIKAIVLKYQDELPDTVISKKLGISRKSLWERRKKLHLKGKVVSSEKVNLRTLAEPFKLVTRSAYTLGYGPALPPRALCRSCFR